MVECRSEVHIFLIIVGVINYIFIVVLCVVCLYFFTDESPVSRVPWSLADVRMEMVRVGKLFFAGIFMDADPNFDYALVYLGVVLVADGFTIYGHVFYTSYLNLSVQVVDIMTTVSTVLYSAYLAILIVRICRHSV
ncbi:MAG: hypothetical protein P4M11_11245 [Candidatus Pacebacteria bacterium]|nr:hypothetical protein [Candidatus Paceibacterota bacterium]